MQVSKRDGISVAVFDGDDFCNPSFLEDAFQHLIEGLNHQEVIIDLSRVTAVTSLGVAVLVAAQGIALIYDTRLAFAGIQPGVHRVLALVGVDKALSLHDTVDEGLRALRSSPRRSAAYTWAQ